MFPGIYEFAWDTGHIVFLGAFYTAFAGIVTMLVYSFFRARRDVASGQVEALRWHEDFEHLPDRERICRHTLTGTLGPRTCQSGFDCRHCEVNGTLDPAALETAEAEVYGFTMPPDRLYHRGHTWVRREADGTVSVGLDDFAARLLSEARPSQLPAVGERLIVNGTGWRMEAPGTDVRILSPVDGEVAAVGGSGDDFVLKVKPTAGALDDRHLLRGGEVRAWMLREIERFAAALSGPTALPVLADGGAPVERLAQAIPPRDRDAVIGAMLLDP